MIVLLVAAGYGMYQWSIEPTATEKYSQEGDYTKYRTCKDGEAIEFDIPGMYDRSFCSLSDVPYNHPEETADKRYEAIKAAFDKSVDSSYVVVYFPTRAIALSRNDFVKKVNEGLETLKSDEYDITLAIFEENSIETVEGWLKDTLVNLTGSSQHGRFELYKHWAAPEAIPWKSFSAFEKSISPKECIEPRAIQKTGLKLKIENLMIQKFIAAYASPDYYVEIEADVTTEKRSKNIKDDWIPQKGQTKKVDFILSTRISNYAANQVQVYDIAVKGYN